MKLNIKKRNEVVEIEPITITMTITADDFRTTFNREPKDQDEFQQFTDLCQLGIENQISWDIVKNSAKTYMEYK